VRRTSQKRHEEAKGVHRLRRGTTVLAAVPAMLLACQSAPPAPPPVSETETSSASEPPPFSDLASDIERQMEAERAAALERGAALRERSQLEPEGELDEAMRARRLVEQELGEERLRKSEASLGGLSVTGCVRSEEQIRSLGDVILHRRITPRDFRARQSGDLQPLVDSDTDTPPRIIAHVALQLLCALEVQMKELRPGLFEARASRIRHFAVMDRRQSWWGADAGSPEWVLAHEQLHFDLAELTARELDRDLDALRQKTRGRGFSADMALEEFEKSWARHMRVAREGLRDLELRYDRETRQGTDAVRQEEWARETRQRLLEAERAAHDPAPVGP